MKEKKKFKKWQIVLLVIVVIGVIGAATGGGDKNKEKESEPKISDENKPAEEKKEQAKKDEPKEEEKTFSIGDVVAVGDVEYTVNSISSSDTIGDEYINTKAQNMFLIVDVTIKNNGNKALTVADSFFKLKKGDKEYSTDSGSAIYLSDESIIFSEINPDASLTGKILFDITQETIDSADLQLQVQTGVWGTEKGLINLH